MSSHSFSFDVEDGHEQLPADPQHDDSARNRYETIIDNDDDYDAPQSENDNNQDLQFPPRRKACFLLSYFSFVVSYLILLLATALTYPLNPVSEIIDIRNLPLEGPVDKIDQPDVHLQINFINRNPIIRSNYDDGLNITIYYISPHGSDGRFIIASTRYPQFSQRGRKHTRVDVTMTTAPELPASMNETGTIYYQVKLEFNVTFNCSGPYKHKRRPLTLAINYP